MYAFGAYGGPVILQATIALAKQSKIPMRNLTLVNRPRAPTPTTTPRRGVPEATRFFSNLVPFLRKVARPR